MNLIISFLFLCLMMSSCAFKKDVDRAAPQTNTIQADETSQLFEIVKRAPYEVVKSRLKELEPEKVNSLERDGYTLLETAIQRGNAHVVHAVLEKGASPYKKGSATGKKPYQYISMMPNSVGKLLGDQVVQTTIKDLLSTDGAGVIWERLRSRGMNCTDLLNIHSFFGLSMGMSFPIVEAIASNYCQNSLDLHYFQDWLISELIGQVRFNPIYPGFITYLQKVKDSNTMVLELNTPDGKFTMTPYTFLSLALQIPSLKESHERIENIKRTFSPNNRPISFRHNNRSESLMLDKMYILDDISKQELDEIGTKIMMATSGLNLLSFPNCLQLCQKTELPLGMDN